MIHYRVIKTATQLEQWFDLCQRYDENFGTNLSEYMLPCVVFFTLNKNNVPHIAFDFDEMVNFTKELV